jgi:hypothetical protein
MTLDPSDLECDCDALDAAQRQFVVKVLRG